MWNIYCVDIYMSVEYYSAIKKDEMPFAATGMDLEILIMSDK